MKPRPFDRRALLHGGFSAAALGMLARRGFPVGLEGGCVDTGARPLDLSMPVVDVSDLGPTRTISGLPFSVGWKGDPFEPSEIPFHTQDACVPPGAPPTPTEEVDVVVVGGGISGLCTAYLLREHRPVLFELRDRFGGSAQGERWLQTDFSFGNAYVITPDPGTFLETLYTELGLPDVVRVDDQDPTIEVGGEVVNGFFDGAGQPPDVVAAFERYREIVLQMAGADYPDIPLPKGKDNQWILDLDRKTFREDIEEKMAMPIPDVLAAAVQAYTYSSFAAGWEEISAASGWNFLAAEEYGRWVFPGGTTYMTQQFWNRLAELDADLPPGCSPQHLRAGCRVVDVRPTTGRRVLVTYHDSQGSCRTLSARKVVMCCPKFVAKRALFDLHSLDAEKELAIEQLDYRAYVVANVLLTNEAANAMHRGFYDIFLLGNGGYPMSQDEFAEHSFVTDVLNGHFARPVNVPRNVLTLYWPLPFDFGRWTLLTDTSFDDYAHSLAGQLRLHLELVGLKHSDVVQIRLIRWGHALPIARPNIIADGMAEKLRRPIDDLIYFVNQDNWALPAVENCLLDAEFYVPQVRAGL